LSQHHYDLGWLEGARFNSEPEGSESLGHVRVGEHSFVVLVGLTGFEQRVLIILFTNFERKRLLSELQVLSWDESRKEDVDSLSDGHWHCDDTIGTWCSV